MFKLQKNLQGTCSAIQMVDADIFSAHGGINHFSDVQPLYQLIFP
jgi:hypothetical protein